MDGLTRGQLAVRAQVNLETIRFYEAEGLLPIAPRTASGYRKFSESTVERLAFVKSAKALGFSLEEIRELLHLQSEQAGVCAEVRELLRSKLSVVREKRAELERLESQLSAALHKCNKALKQQLKQQLNPAEACPVLRQIGDARPRNAELESNGARRVVAEAASVPLTKAKPRMKKDGWRR
jgi:MerR family transcriptional regulator, mercuric resistance operon regulatory protein